MLNTFQKISSIKNFKWLILNTSRCQSQNYAVSKNEIELPKYADVIVIGGGSAGCHALYHLTKFGVKAVLLERNKLTSGTTWHTAGLIWRLRPNDVDIKILESSRNLLNALAKETCLDPGWIENGGIFIAHSKVRLEEYKRLAGIGNVMGIENYMLNPHETKKLFPLLNENSFMGALYSPGDGVVDPALLCAALKKSAISNGATVFENCPVDDLVVSDDLFGGKKIMGVKTPYGDIQTSTVINATGVWGRDLVQKYGSILPLIPMKHSYIVTESIDGVRGLPNIRDHDYSIYFRIQGDSICMGGYELNPVILKTVPKTFKFGLYDLDWSVFEPHVEKAIDLCPSFNKSGVKCTICGPESFTPDHKPLMGPDVNINGLYHSCGYNSAGMMFGGGCGEQIALWVINGQPSLPMFQFDVRRFTKTQISNHDWVNERSHESYVKNYSIVFPHDQPLAGRNVCLDPLHKDMLESNAFMEEKQGWERPGFFLQFRADVARYDWYGSYNFPRYHNSPYEKCLTGDLKYQFSEYHNLIGNEALTCRKQAVVFNMSYFGKMYLEGPDAEMAAEWLFSSNLKNKGNKVIYTCALNDAGGVEADLTLCKIKNFPNKFYDKKIQDNVFYIVCGGASAYYTFHFLSSEIQKKKFKACLHNVTEDFGIISIQGPSSRFITEAIVDVDISDNCLPQNTAIFGSVKTRAGKKKVKILRVSFVGELGYELHVPNSYCSDVYKHLMKIGEPYGLINAGYRALYSLSSEKGYHLWGFDLRSDDTPIEANLAFTCRRDTPFRGKEIVDNQKKMGVNKKLIYLTLDEQLPLWGLEAVYRNGQPVGFLRRGEYAYVLNKSIGQLYLKREDGNVIDNEYINAGHYEIDVMGKLHKACCHLKSPFN